MIGLVLLAVLLDRRGLSMRLVAWAALIVLALQPESLLGASFQMSFAAVTALIAVYETACARRLFSGERRWSSRAAIYVGAVALTSIVAAAATAPFVVYHFNRLAAYGLAANLVAVPLTALWVMPWAVTAFALMPLGLETLALQPMGWGVATIIHVAETVAAWPGAVSVRPPIPVWGLLVVVFGGLWACLWRGRWRVWGLGAAVLGLASTLAADPPDVLVDGRGRLLAVRTADGGLAVSSKRARRFERDIWLRRTGVLAPTPWPEGVSADGRLRCDALGCIYRVGGHVVALARTSDALAEDCRFADVVVAVVPVRRRCPSARLVVDRFDLWRHGGHALWLSGDTIRVESVNGHRGRRPWVVTRE